MKYFLIQLSDGYELIEGFINELDLVSTYPDYITFKEL